MRKFFLTFCLLFHIAGQAIDDMSSARLLSGPGLWRLITQDIYGLQSDPYQKFEEYFLDYGLNGDPVNVWIPFVKNIVLISQPDDINELFRAERKDLVKKGQIINDVSEYLLGQGMAALEKGELYHELHGLFARHLTSTKIEGNIESIENWSEDFLNHLDRLGSDKDFHDLESEILTFTMGVICRTMLDYAITVNEAKTMGSYFNTILQFIQYRMTTAPFVIPVSIPSAFNISYHNAKDKINTFVDKIMTLEDEKIQRGTSNGGLLYAIMSSEYSYEVKRDQVINIFFGGHETTAHLIVMSLYRLSKHPEVLQKLQNELQNEKFDHTSKNLSKLNRPFLDAFINEVLRLDSPISAYGREVVEPFELNGIEMSKGTIIIASQYFTHRLESIWEKPFQFNPNRFIENRFSHTQFYPFGVGSRKCVGKSLAVMEAKIFLLKYLSHYMDKNKMWIHNTEHEYQAKIICTSRINGGVLMKLSEHIEASKVNDCTN